MSSGDALSGADGTQSPDAAKDPLRAEPAPHMPLPGLDLPPLPELPSVPELGEQLAAVGAASTYDAVSTDYPAEAIPTAPDQAPFDEAPTPPAWPAVSPADVPPLAAEVPPSAAEVPSSAAEVPSSGAPPPPEPSAPPVAPTTAQPAPAQQPTRPARPTIRDAEPSLLGLTKRSRTRVGQLTFTVVFAVIFVVILVQLVISLLTAR